MKNRNLEILFQLICHCFTFATHVETNKCSRYSIISISLKSLYWYYKYSLAFIDYSVHFLENVHLHLPSWLLVLIYHLSILKRLYIGLIFQFYVCTTQMCHNIKSELNFLHDSMSKNGGKKKSTKVKAKGFCYIRFWTFRNM